jgi:hypothetical protein
MAIQSFKDIINTKGYRISSEDRTLFELGDIQSFFGLSENDCIEFILYDANDNQLPQISFGLVRYIPLNSENIKDYFLIAEGTLFQKYKLPSEYFIDAERLIKEAGYNNGIFKTQITLLNNRVGSNKSLDKLWIQEISPSRTEVRLFPSEQGAALNPELKLRYGILVNDGSFREDILRYAVSFAEAIKPNYISSYLKTNFGEKWFNKMISEFQIKEFDAFAATIYNKMLEGTIYEFTNRISDINDLNYGKPKITPPSVALSKEIVKSTVEKILIRLLNKYIINPTITYTDGTYQVFESPDAVEEILQSKESDLEISTNPPVQKTIITTKPNPTLPVLDVVKERIKTHPELGPIKEIIQPDDVIRIPIIDEPKVQIESPIEINPVGFDDGVLRTRGGVVGRRILGYEDSDFQSINSQDVSEAMSMGNTVSADAIKKKRKGKLAKGALTGGLGLVVDTDKKEDKDKGLIGIKKGRKTPKDIVKAAAKVALLGPAALLLKRKKKKG